MSNYVFLLASTREPGHVGNTEFLAREAAASLPATAMQTWLRLSEMQLPPFVDVRHTAAVYSMPEGDMKTLLDATLACTDLVLVAPVYWYSFPAALKTYLDHWSAWMRIPGLPFKEEMAKKRLHLITTSGDRAKAQPMIDSTRLCAAFLGMQFAEPLWARGGPPDATRDALGSDTESATTARAYFCG